MNVSNSSSIRNLILYTYTYIDWVFLVSHRSTDIMSPSYEWSTHSSLLNIYGTTQDRIYTPKSIMISHDTSPIRPTTATRDLMITHDINQRYEWEKNSANVNKYLYRKDDDTRFWKGEKEQIEGVYNTEDITYCMVHMYLPYRGVM